MVDDRSKEDFSRRGDGVPGSTPQDSAEAKRLEARRRFLLGGATAIPILVTVNRAKAATRSECFSSIDKPDNEGVGNEEFPWSPVNPAREACKPNIPEDVVE